MIPSVRDDGALLVIGMWSLAASGEELMALGDAVSSALVALANGDTGNTA